MSSMGSTCSMQRHRSVAHSQNNSSRNGYRRRAKSSTSSPTDRRFSRHSVVVAVPDDSISNFYPRSDNYIVESNGLRSPKSLAELCTDTLCRSLPCVDGELPPGLPQDVVDDVVASLVKHNALNATTLRILKNCELGTLSLSGARGVTDDWLDPLSSTCKNPQVSPDSSTTFYPAAACIEEMDLDDYETAKSEVFCNTSSEPNIDSPTTSMVEESSCSTSSFVSASSTSFDHKMTHYVSDADKKQSSQISSTTSETYDDNVFSFDSPMSVNPATANIKLLDIRGSQHLTDKGLTKLTDLSSLEVALLDNCYSVVGQGLRAFSVSHRLHTLSLANCRRLTDEAIMNISHLNSLVALSLGGCRCLTDRSLAALSGLFRLKKLDLSQCDLITDEGIEHIQTLEEIEELNLGWCRLLTDDGLDALTKQPGRSNTLRVLGLARCSITDIGVEHLPRLQVLEELDLNGCTGIGSGSLGKALGSLQKLKNLDVSFCPGILRSSWQGRINSLESLELNYSTVRDSHMAKLTDLPSLLELNLDSCRIGDWSISHLADNNVMPNLISLDLADTDLSDLGMVHIANFKKLQRLSLFYCNITNGGLRHLSQLKFLEVLNLDSREIGDDGLWHLRHLSRLKSLDVFSGRITDSGCAHLSKIKSLESLELCGGGIGDMGCTLLATLENLTSLNLSQNERITNRGAAALAQGLTNLKALNLSNTRVNSGALGYFTHLLSLQSLALYGCRGIEDSRGLNRLQSGLPSLKCVRLSNGSAEDGIIMDTDDSSEDSDSELDSDSGMLYSRRTAVAPFQDTDSDESSDMEYTDDRNGVDIEDDDNGSYSSSSYYSDY